MLLFATAAVLQVGEDMFDSSACFLDGTEMRPRVAYLLGTGSVLRLGESRKGCPCLSCLFPYPDGRGGNGAASLDWFR